MKLTATQWGIAIGVIVALATVLGGLAGFLLTLFFGGLGGVIGAHLDGLIDLRSILSRGTRGRG